MKPKPLCATCRFLDWGTGEYAYCKRHAPHPKPEVTGYGYDISWPIVESDEWCGEHEPEPRDVEGEEASERR